MARPVLVIIDMLGDFVNEGAPLHVPGARSLVEPIDSLRTVFREVRLPILYLCDAHEPEDPEFADWPAHAVRGTEGAQVIPELAPGPGARIFRKQFIDPFQHPELEEQLKKLKADHLIITGVATEYCVKELALGALKRGLTATVVLDGVAAVDKSPGEGESALDEMEQAGVTLAESVEVVSSVAGLPL